MMYFLDGVSHQLLKDRPEHAGNGAVTAGYGSLLNSNELVH